MHRISALFLIFLLLLESTCFAANVIIPKDTQLVGELVTPLNSKASKVGDPIVFKIVKNFVLEKAIIVPKGTSGRAVVTLAEKATYFGQGGQIGFKPDVIRTGNGVEIPLSFETAKRGDAVNDANMAAAVVGFGIFSAFFHGKNQTIPAGTKFTIFVAEDTDLGISKEDLGKYFYILK